MARKKTRRGTTASKKTRGSKRRGRPRGSGSKKTTTRGKAGRRGRPRTLSTLSSEQLRSELNRRLEDLEERRRELQEELDGLQEELQVLGGAAKRAEGSGTQATPRKKRGRPKGSKNKRRGGSVSGGRTRRRGRGGQSNLADALSNVLRGKDMGITEMAESVKKSGYRTNSSNFTAVVSQTLGRNPDLFRKTGRGRYTTR